MEGLDKATAFLLDLESQRKIPLLSTVCKLGRDIENDVVIPEDGSTSRFHTVIKCEDGKYIVEDADSRNGTFINGTKLTSPTPINDGDMLKIGNSIFWFVVESD